MNIVERFYLQKKNLSQLKLRDFENYDAGMLLTDNITLYLCFGIKKFSGLKMLIPIFIDEFKYDFGDIKEQSILIFNSYAYSFRSDYKRSCKRFREIIRNTAEAHETKCWGLSRTILRNICNAVTWNRQLKQCDIPKNERFFLIKKLLRCWKLNRTLQLEEDKLKKIGVGVFQFDAMDVENLFSQFLQMRKIPTVTLQHGHFHHTEYITENIYHVSPPFEGFVSDYFFSWGEYTDLEAEECGIDRKRIIDVGSLKNHSRNIIRTPDSNIFAVILNGAFGFEENDNLLDWADKIYEQYNLKYIVRPHPGIDYNSLTYDKHKGFTGVSDGNNESIPKMAEKVKFCLCGNSTVLTELIFIKASVIMLRPSFSIDTYSRIEGLAFSNENELNDILNLLLYDRNSYSELVDKYNKMFFCTADIESTYQNAIDTILRVG